MVKGEDEQIGLAVAERPGGSTINVDSLVS